MSHGVFVTGTDTGVGKTVASCALVQALRARGVRVAPMKPVAAGDGVAGGFGLNDDTIELIAAAGFGAADAKDVTPVLLHEAIAPHIAAEHEGRTIDLHEIVAAFDRLRARADFLVVEGVGGFCVPLGPKTDTVGLACLLALPVVLVVGLRLGCLNHALLTAQAIRAANLPLAGWIANTIDPDMPVREENVGALVERLQAPLLGRLPYAPGANPRELAAGLDVGPLLA